MSSSSLPRANYEPWRAVVFYVVLGLGFSILIARLFSLQVLQFSDWKAQADENRTREISVQPSRGIIYDRNSYILANNIASYNIVITPSNLPDDPADIQEIYRQLSELTGIPVNNGTLEEAKLVSICVPGPGIAQTVALGESIAPYTAVPISCNVSDMMARKVREKAMDWPGVSIQIEPVRNYPTGSLTANLIGFLGPIPAAVEQGYRDKGFLPNRDKIGYAGVELSFQDILEGVPGRRLAEVDVAGQAIRNLEPPVAPVAGNNLVLTIDTRLQKAAEAALTGQIKYWNNRLGPLKQISSGVTIAMNPKTGEILAMVSTPSYENNRLARIIPAYYYRQLEADPRKLMLNHAVADEYPPGSVFKLSTVTGALNEGIVRIGQMIETPGLLTVQEKYSANDYAPPIERKFVDWNYNQEGVLNPEGFGQLDVLHCIAYSSNVCFYKLGGGWKDEIPEGLGIERLGEYARALGYDNFSGIALPGEANGLIPSKKWKRINQGENWSSGDTYIASVGQGLVLATPLQVLESAATIANDGKHMQPTIVREITDSEGRVLTKWFNPTEGTVTDTPTTLTKTTPLDLVSYQISPFAPTLRWDATVDKLITDYQCDGGYCAETGSFKPIQPWVIQRVQEGMRFAVTDTLYGTLNGVYSGDLEKQRQFNTPFPIAVAGKTGTAEYCDNVAQANNRCGFGKWPTHAWTVSYAPYDDPEIVVVAFTYNGGEGAAVAAPVVRQVLEAYFCLKTLDANPDSTAGCD
jgi:penicillin-binding protein 2